MASNESRRVSDLGTLKAFGHPLRMKLYRALYIARQATASQLAEQVDEQVSLVSYHLRKLADHGLIEEADREGKDGRERWWQPASKGLRFHDEDFSDAPEKAATHTAVEAGSRSTSTSRCTAASSTRTGAGRPRGARRPSPRSTWPG